MDPREMRPTRCLRFRPIASSTAPRAGRRAPGELGGVGFAAGQQKGAKFSPLKAHISASFHSFQLIFGRVIISPQVLVG